MHTPYTYSQAELHRAERLSGLCFAGWLNMDGYLIPILLDATKHDAAERSARVRRLNSDGA
jgi:hypothetical protein